MLLVLFALTSLLATRTTVSGFCSPDENILECSRRNKESAVSKPNEIKETPCLGVDQNDNGMGISLILLNKVN